MIKHTQYNWFFTVGLCCLAGALALNGCDSDDDVIPQTVTPRQPTDPGTPIDNDFDDDGNFDFDDDGNTTVLPPPTLPTAVIGAPGQPIPTQCQTPAIPPGEDNCDPSIIIPNGSDGDDVINASDCANNINGGAGNDVIRGFKGDDTLRGGRGDDVIRGGKGNDDIFGDRGNDTLHGDQGNDTFYIGFGDDILEDNGGEDTIVCQQENGVSFSIVSETREGDDHVYMVQRNGTDEVGRVVVRNHYKGCEYMIENVRCN